MYYGVVSPATHNLSTPEHLKHIYLDYSDLSLSLSHTQQNVATAESHPSVNSCCHCCVNEICTLLGFYAAKTGSLLLTFRNNLLDPWTDRLSRNVGTKLLLYAASDP
jgi:hypothetical protein